MAGLAGVPKDDQRHMSGAAELSPWIADVGPGNFEVPTVVFLSYLVLSALEWMAVVHQKRYPKNAISRSFNVTVSGEKV